MAGVEHDVDDDTVAVESPWSGVRHAGRVRAVARCRDLGRPADRIIAEELQFRGRPPRRLRPEAEGRDPPGSRAECLAHFGGTYWSDWALFMASIASSTVSSTVV